ncbi:basic proline-rich protein-like [Lathamus discolor]|uniref:basic proline-rich protein-like n=1 Tax=Lathamus discolor TaxID=678569 RepID=UPI0032B770C0
MFSPTGCRRGFPRQPGPWQVGPSPPRPYGPHNTWDEMPQHRRSRGQWCRPDPWEPFPGPADFHVDEEDRGWAPSDCLPPLSWHNEECDQGPEECFEEGWYSPWFSEPTPFPGPDDFYGNEENRRWGPRDGLPPPHWDNEECDQRPEICSEEGWYPPWSCDPRPFPGPADYYGNEEYWGWAPNDWSAPCFWGARDDEGPEECFREGWHPEMMPPHPNCSTWPEFPNEGQHPPWPPAHQTGERDGFQDDFRPWGFRGPARRPFQRVRRGHRKSTMVMRPPPFRPRGYRPPPQSSPSSGMSQPVAKEEPQTLTPIKADVQSREPQAKDLPAASQKVLKCPGATDTSQKSLATDPPVATEAVKPEQAAGATLVEPCSQSSPEAGAGSYPCSPTAPPEPAEPPQGQQCRAEATSAGVPPGGPTEPKVQPKEASSYTCIKSETSPGTQHPPASSEVKPAAGGSQQLCSGLPQPSSASRDLRSAAVLARKEKIELSYQQFSLTIAVVATMLLQKEPSMEAALGLALRANLRQGRIHHLQELEDFINSYDLATPSH